MRRVSLCCVLFSRPVGHPERVAAGKRNPYGAVCDPTGEWFTHVAITLTTMHTGRPERNSPRTTRGIYVFSTVVSGLFNLEPTAGDSRKFSRNEYARNTTQTLKGNISLTVGNRQQDGQSGSERLQVPGNRELSPMITGQQVTQWQLMAAR